MKWLKRCTLSITRRPVKTLLLFLVVFAMGNLLAGSLAIITTSKTVKNEIERGLGAEATIAGHFFEVDAEIYDIKQVTKAYHEVVTTLANQECVDYGEYHYTMSGLLPYGGIDMYAGITGTNIPEPSEFRSGDFKLQKTQGARMFTQEEIDQGAMVALVSRDFGQDDDGNNTGFTKPGNKITIAIPLGAYIELDQDGNQIEHPIEYTFEVEVVGAFSCKYGQEIYLPSTTFMNVIEEANKYVKVHGGSEVDYEILYSAYKLKDTKQLEEFDTLAKDLMKKLPESFVYTSTSEAYERSAGPVENLDTVAKVIFITSVIATIIILGLVIVFFISDRKKEMGIYASLGEKKKNIVFQVLTEILIISTLAISSASLSGIVIGNELSDYMLEVQRYVKRKQDLGKLADLPVIYKPITDGLTGYSRDEVIDSYNAKPTAEYFAVLYAVGELTIVVSCVVPMVYLTKLKPKDTLI